MSRETKKNSRKNRKEEVSSFGEGPKINSSQREKENDFLFHFIWFFPVWTTNEILKNDSAHASPVSARWHHSENGWNRESEYSSIWSSDRRKILRIKNNRLKKKTSKHFLFLLRSSAIYYDLAHMTFNSRCFISLSHWRQSRRIQWEE